MGVRARQHRKRHATEALPVSEVTLRLADAVVHLDHGMGMLRGLEAVEAADVTSETIRLEYARKQTLLAPIDEIDRIWRYGTGASRVKLDGLDGGGWAKRRAQVEEHVAQTARALVEEAQAKEKAKAPVLRPPPRDYARFAARFPFTETEDPGAGNRGDIA
jgi:transcription-repair coupling factor (superfamily II helicase)